MCLCVGGVEVHTEFLHPASLYVLRQVLSLNLELADVPTAAGEQAPTVLWSQTPQCWNNRHVLLRTSHGCLGSNPGPRLCGKYFTEPSPQPFTCLSESDIFYSIVHSFSVNDMLVFSMLGQYSTVNVYHIFFNSSSAGGRWTHRLTP